MRTLLTVLLLLYSVMSFAQDYKFKHYDVGNGLSNNKVNVIYKDHDGFLWVGTASGLNRYDGNRFKVYYSSKDDESSLPDNYVVSVQEDVDGNLYVNSGNVYAVYNRLTDSFDRDLAKWLKLPGENISIHELYIDKDKNIWACHQYNAVYLYRQKEGKLIEVTKTDKRLVESRVTKITETPEHIVFACGSGKIYFMNRKTLKIEKEAKVPENITGDVSYTVFYDKSQMWVYSVNGVWTLDMEAKKWTNKRSCIGENAVVNCITQDDKDNIWMGQDRLGVAVLEKNGDYTNMLSLSGFDGSSVSTMFVDNNGSVWIGTYKKGLYQYNENMFKFKLNNFPDVNCITGTIYDANIAWVGTDAGELIKWDYVENKSESFQCSKNAIVCVYAQNHNDVWVGTYLEGLKHFCNGRVVEYRTSDGLASDNVWALCGAPDGKVWIGTLGGGIQLLDPATGKFETYNTSNSDIGNDYINSMIQSRNGDLYIGTTQGVSIFNHNTKKFKRMLGSHDAKEIFAYPNVIQLVEDAHGLLWMATIEGLYVFSEATDKVYNVAIPKKDNPFILGLSEDNMGDIWISVGAEIIKVITHTDATDKSLTFDFNTYNQKDGLQNSDFNQRSFYRTPTGVMLVGGLYGINSFSPQYIKYNKSVPHVLFSDIRLFHQSIKVGQKYDGRVILEQALNAARSVDLGYKQNDFTVDFASDNFIAPENTVYYYRLLGFNSEWIECGIGIHQATYTNLAPGKYILEVKAVNNDGVESDAVASLSIVIHPPFWATIWAEIYYLVVLISIAVLVIRYIRQRDRVKYMRAQEEEETKHKEEMVQLELKFFTNISHDLRTPLTLILSPLDSLIRDEADEKQKTRLTMVKSNADRLLQMVNQLLDYRKIETSGLSFIPAEGDIVTFIKGQCDGFNEYADNRGVKLTFFSSQEAIDMSFDADKMGKIMQNLLSNAFKFTPNGGRVDVALTNVNNNLILKVADTGIGIPDDEKSQIFARFYQTRNTVSGGTGIGLSLVKEYVKSHNGTVEVTDNVGGGTVFIITIPIVHVSTAAEEEAAETETEAVDTNELNQPDNTGHKYTALVVDDDEALLSFMYDELSESYTVLKARDGVEALEVMETNKPDIVVSDIMMPRMDGIELCRHIKSDRDTSIIPLILLSSKYSLDTKVEGLEAGADDYITKPFNMDVLKLRIKKMIELRHNDSGLIEVEPSPVKITSKDEEMVDYAIKYVEENIQNPELSVDDLLSNASSGLSKANFYKRLRNVTGKTPTEFIRTIRLKRAMQLLKESEMNISEVAYQVGYNNPRYFSLQFKEEFKVSPSDIIKKRD